MAVPSDASPFHVRLVQYRFCQRARCRRLALDLAHRRSPKGWYPRGRSDSLTRREGNVSDMVSQLSNLVGL